MLLLLMLVCVPPKQGSALLYIYFETVKIRESACHTHGQQQHKSFSRGFCSKKGRKVEESNIIVTRSSSGLDFFLRFLRRRFLSVRCTRQETSLAKKEACLCEGIGMIFFSL